MATIINRPSVHLNVGVHGPFATPSDIALGINGYKVTITKTTDWPTTGVDACKILIEVSLDHGTTWQEDASLTLPIAPWIVRGGAITDTQIWIVDRPPNANRLRATITNAQAATMAITVDTL